MWHDEKRKKNDEQMVLCYVSEQSKGGFAEFLPVLTFRLYAY